MASQYRRRTLMLNTIAKVAQGNPTIITDSSSRRLQKLNIYGQSEQASTTGAQLLDITKGIGNIAYGLTSTIEGDYLRVKGTSSVTIKNASFAVYAHNDYSLSGKGYVIKAFGNTLNQTMSIYGFRNSEEKSIAIITELVEGKAYDFKFKIMVSVEEPTSYEPYTGGKPSPSPDYPQDMLSKEVSEIKIHGTNLFDLEKEKKVSNTNWNEERQCFYPRGVSYYIGMVINEVWDIAHESDNLLTVSFDIKSDKNGKVRVYSLGNRNLKVVAGETDYVDTTQEYVRQYVHFRTIDNRGRLDQTGEGDNCKLSFYGVADGESVIPEVKNICISVTENTEYIPFESQTITLSEPITLRGIPVDKGGNVTIDGQQYVSDVITEKDGVIGVERDTIPLSLLVKDMNNSDAYPGWHPIEVVDKILPPNVNDSQITNTLCNIISRTIYARRDNKTLYFVAGELGKNQTELKEQHPDLSVNFIVINHQPTFEPLPEEVQAQYKVLKSYYPNTVIQTGCWNEVTYSAKRGG